MLKSEMSYKDCVRLIRAVNVNSPVSIIEGMRATEALKDIERSIGEWQRNHIDWMCSHVKYSIMLTLSVTLLLILLIAINTQ
jgi:hypothetical protein